VPKFEVQLLNPSDSKLPDDPLSELWRELRESDWRNTLFSGEFLSSVGLGKRKLRTREIELINE